MTAREYPTVNFPWAISLDRGDATSLAAFRLVPNVEVGEAAGVIWLRGNRGDEELDSRLAALPCRGRYEWIAPNQLRQIDQRIPSARLPELRWQPLNAWLQVELATAAIPVDRTPRVPLVLARSTDEREPDLLLTTLDELRNFVRDAARIRLNRLQFAMNANGEVLVRGKPLPPLPGRQFVLHGSIAVPAGFSWCPAVGGDALARAFNVAVGTILIWQEDNTVNRLQAEQFLPLTRGAVRASGQVLVEL